MLSTRSDARCCITEYRICLQTDAGRFNTLLHAREAAEEMNRDHEAGQVFQLLSKNAADSRT